MAFSSIFWMKLLLQSNIVVPVSSGRGVGAHVGLISLRASKVEVEEEETGVVTGGGGGGGRRVVGVVTTRRLALALVAGVIGSLNSRVAPASAAYGEAANVFGTLKKQTGFTPYVGAEGFKLEIPSKWNPSREVEFPGQVLRYEDNFDATNNLSVSITPSSKSSIKDYGSPEDFLASVSYFLGKQSYSGKTSSEGGFSDDAVATAALLESSATEIDGKPYYKLSVLTRTADGDEGGKHQLFVATISDGKLYVLKAQAGDKRWFKGAKKFVEGSINSFSVA
ncbi:unnamed protein product [Sphagnum jensenii]|uniref:23 kDa subunit of oxygen evolving system of photosystem II n=1 Tax=Sphagnum jensenii TaxID=128206 RepID=A0ABP1AGE9_9BRYO